jgi:hypothetical protein
VAWDITDATDEQLEALLTGSHKNTDPYAAILDGVGTPTILCDVEISHYCSQSKACGCIHCTADADASYDYEGAILAGQEDESWGV